MEEQNPELIALAINKILQVFTMFFSTLDKFKDWMEGGREWGELTIWCSPKKSCKTFFFLVSC